LCIIFTIYVRIIISAHSSARPRNLTTLLETTLPQAVQGTIPYLSPELLDNQPFSPFDDQWGLIVTMYQCFTGRLPFSGETQYKIVRSISKCHDQGDGAGPRARTIMSAGFVISTQFECLEKILSRGLSAKQEQRSVESVFELEVVAAIRLACHLFSVSP
jgi:serine/threonine protein kinase